jgi:tetratricopeptide (TPR) repeat protein
LGRYYLETQKFSLARTIFKKLAIASEEKIIAALKKDAPEKKIDLHLVYNALWRLYGFSILYLSQGLTSKPSQQKKVSSLITEAEKVFKKALSYNSADITSQLGLGVVYYNQKKWQEAGNEILSVLNVEPTNQDAKNYLDILRQTIGQIIYDACNKRTKKFTKRHEEFPITILVESIIETLNKLLADADSETAKQIFGPADLAQTVVAITEQLKPISAVRDLVFQLYMAGLLTLADAARLAKLTTAEFLNNILGPVEISKEHLSFTPAEIDKKAAIELLQSWQKEKPTPEDDEDWQMTKESIDESRHSTRKLFA